MISAASTITPSADEPEPLRDVDSQFRANNRNRKVMLSGTSSAVARALQIATSLIAVPFTIRYLGNERFGLWMTINSVLAIVSFADFGLGNGLLNIVARAYGEDNVDEIEKAVSSAFIVLLGISLILATIFFASYGLVDWVRIFNVHSAVARHEAGPSIAVFFLCFAVSLPFGIVQRIQLAYQEGFLNGVWAVAGNILGLAALLLAIRQRFSLPWLVAAIVGIPTMMLVLNSIVLFCRRPYLRPKWSSYSGQMSERILKTGGLFFVLQISMALAYQTDNLVIAHLLGPESVTQYAVPLRIFQCVPTFIGFFLLALWPAYSEAAARQDSRWIRSTYRRSLILNIAISLPAALFLLATTRTIIHYWIGDGVRPSLLLLAGLAGYCITTALIGPIAALMNGLHVLRFQAVCWFLMAIVNLCLSIFLTRSFGISGVVMGSIIAQILFIIIPSLLRIPVCLQRLEKAPGDLR